MDIEQRQDRPSKALPAPLGSKKGRSKLTHVHLVGLNLNNYAWGHLKKGIETSRVLKTLIINMTSINREQLTMLADAMKTNLSIDTLDLSYNKLADADGDIIARIISNQTQLRDS